MSRLYWRIASSTSQRHFTGRRRRHSDEVAATVTSTSEGWRWAVWGPGEGRRAPLYTGLADSVEQGQIDAERALDALKGAA